MHLFRTRGPFTYENNTIRAYPDFTNEVQQRRATFLEIKSRLRTLNMKYALLFPAKLRVVDGDTTHFFTSPEDAWTWLHAKGLVKHDEDSLDSQGWRPSGRQRIRRKRSGRVPTRPQQAQERTKAIEAVALTLRNSFSPLRTEDNFSTGSAESETLDWLGSEGRPPLLTPRSADALG